MREEEQSTLSRNSRTASTAASALTEVRVERKPEATSSAIP